MATAAEKKKRSFLTAFFLATIMAVRGGLTLPVGGAVQRLFELFYDSTNCFPIADTVGR